MELNSNSNSTGRCSDTTNNSNSNNDIAQQVAALDDAHVWMQQLVTTTGSIVVTNDGDGDGGNGTSISSDIIGYYIGIMNDIGRSLYELEYNYCTCYCCHGFYHAPVEIRQCHHHFCSYCIRTKFYATTQHAITHHQRHHQSCPICNCSSCSSGSSRSGSNSTSGGSNTNTSGSSQSTTLTLQPNHRLDTFIQVFRMIRQPLLQVLQPQQQALLQQQQQQQTAATRSSATKSQIQQQFQHLPKLFKKIRLTIQYLQLITNQSLDMEPTTTGTNAQIEMEFEIEKYISKILKYSSPTNDENYDNGNAIPYPSLPKPPQHRPSTLTKVILNNKTTRKQMVELLCQKCGFCTSTITSIISNYTKSHVLYLTDYFFQGNPVNFSIGVQGKQFLNQVLRRHHISR